MITNTEAGTNVHEVADGIYRISTPVPPDQMPGGFSFNQYLVVDEEPLLFHLGMRSLFPLVSEAIAKVMPLERLRYLAFSHFEADECGALNQLLAVAPRAVPVCSQTGAMISIGDFSDRPPRPLADGEVLTLGRHRLRWVDTPHVPHGWEAGYLYDETTRTLFCGDLFTQGGTAGDPLTSDDILLSSENFRRMSREALGLPEYFANPETANREIRKIASLNPAVLACMHGSAFAGPEGDASELLLGLAAQLQPTEQAM